MRGKTKTIYYHYDGLGSVVALTDKGGNVVKKYNYSPFGTLVPQGVASPYLTPARERLHKHFPPSRKNTITYTGREYDPDSGLYFYRARYYDSRVGRFTSKDPIRSINPYVYVGNNPINYTDPYGLQKEGEFPCVTPVPPKTPTPPLPQKYDPTRKNPCEKFRKTGRGCIECCYYLFTPPFPVEVAIFGATSLTKCIGECVSHGFHD